MMPIPSYQLLAFLSWLQRRNPIDAGEVDLERIEVFAREFLLEGGFDGATIDYRDLRGLMLVFQHCPMISESTVLEQMAHFSGCGQCIDMMRRNVDSPRPERRRFRLPQSADDWHPRRDGDLHPLLRGFVDTDRAFDLNRHVRAASARLTEQNANDEDFRDIRFRRLIDNVGAELRSSFEHYIDEVRERDPELISSYEAWRLRPERNEEWRGDIRGARRRLGREAEDGAITSSDSVESAAARLASSVRAALESGYYDDDVAQSPQLLRFLANLGGGPKNLAQTLEFLNWLREREAQDLSLVAIPGDELEKLALAFCEQAKYSNAASFAREVRKALSGNAPKSILERIARFLGLDSRPRLPNGQPGARNPLDRYGTVRYHGLFLFLSSDDFPRFLREHWRDLHHLTGDDLDIYFTNGDLEERTSGYELIKDLRSLQIRADGLPAFLLWERKLENAQAIPLHALEHKDVVDVIKAVVQDIRDKYDLRAVCTRGIAAAQALRTRTAGVVVQSGGMLLIKHGGTIVGDSYENKGVAGAMGPHASVHSNQFVQEAGALQSTEILSQEHATVIVALAKALAAHEIEGLSFDERLSGAQHLNALAGTARSGTTPDEALSGWTSWLQSLGARANSVLTTLATIATVATPIARMLGFPG